MFSGFQKCQVHRFTFTPSVFQSFMSDAINFGHFFHIINNVIHFQQIKACDRKNNNCLFFHQETPNSLRSSASALRMYKGVEKDKTSQFLFLRRNGLTYNNQHQALTAITQFFCSTPYSNKHTNEALKIFLSRQKFQNFR